MSEGAFSPRPGAAPLPRMLVAQLLMETRLLLLNGEQLLLTIVIPTLVLVLFGQRHRPRRRKGRQLRAAGGAGDRRDIDGVHRQAIATGFERRYGVLKRVALTPLPRWGFITASTGSVVLVELVQVALLAVVGLVLGWTPRGSILDFALLLVLGTAAFSGLGLLMAGTLRAEATLAGANLVFLLLLVGGGVVVPLDQFPAAAATVLRQLPAGALASGLRDVIQRGGAMPAHDALVLLVWAAAGIAAAGAWFRWECDRGTAEATSASERRPLAAHQLPMPADHCVGAEQQRPTRFWATGRPFAAPQVLVGLIAWSQLLEAAKTNPMGAVGDVTPDSMVLAYADETLRSLADPMAERGAGVMPVVSYEAPERLVGVVSQFDLLRARERLLQQERHRERVLRVRTVPRGEAASGG